MLSNIERIHACAMHILIMRLKLSASRVEICKKNNNKVDLMNSNLGIIGGTKDRLKLLLSTKILILLPDGEVEEKHYFVSAEQ